ncbi:MAG: type III-B CRISPR-associated protein Cas10/Cmr2 [Microscillaceae bacterium]|nr:type III-B CRISPR-associated protein Cas10/Cmr2 [Microscillaceae bacterium]
MTQKYLFLLSISPVQSFIEQARKTQDLRAGSQILSDLIDFAIQEVKSGAKSYELIFPEESIVSKPNRFITILETNENMQDFGDTLKAKIQTHFLEEAKKYLAKTGFYQSCKEQLEDFFKIFWVAKEYKENEAYEPQHKRLEELLGAVKANRPFKQLAEKGRKCSINGELNVKFYRKTEDETKKGKDVKGDNEKLFHSDALVVGNKDFSKIEQDELQAGEGLCAVSFLKRKWNIRESSFPSVAHITLLNEISQFESAEKKKQCFEDYQNIFDEQKFISACIKEFGSEGFEKVKFDNKSDLNTHFDYQLLYTENVTEKTFPYLQQRIFADRFTHILNVKSKYYAILVFDADNMGSKLKEKSKEYQEALSKCLGDFASKATAYIDGKADDKTQKGKTVYAGGDDFLGFINLDYLFEAMRWLRENFDATINKGMTEMRHTSPELTFSAGTAIAHYKTPLSEVLTWARASEKKAKEKYKNVEPAKNAFCLSVLKHSGEIRQSIWKWSYDEDSLTTTLDIIAELVQKLVNEELSSTFIKSLNIEFRKLIDEKNNIHDDNEEVLNYEISRLLLRAKSQGANKADIQILANKIVSLREDDNNVLGGIHNVSDFMQMLDIADFLHRKAHIKPKSKLQTQDL